MDKYLEIFIDDRSIDLSATDDLALAITYKLEDVVTFTTKRGSAALSVVIPATTKNDQTTNIFYNPGIEDLTTNQLFKTVRTAKIVYYGQELLVGKAFLKQASHTNVPTKYEFDFYGNNSDWMIDLKESTLYDFIKHLKFLFTKQNIIDSWNFDGTLENLPYVFAPVKYGKPMETFVDANGNTIEDYNMIPEYMKPSLSKYWIIYWAFKSLGYKIKSDFFDTPYFRRQVVPWTWGSFLSSDGNRLDVLKFLAKTSTPVAGSGPGGSNTIFPFGINVDNDYQNGGYDTSGTYDFISGHTMRWTYPSTPPFNFGVISGMFHFSIFLNIKVTWNSTYELRLQLFKNGQRVYFHNDNGNGTRILTLSAPTVGTRTFTGIVEEFFLWTVAPGDIITMQFYRHTFKSALGNVTYYHSVDELTIDYFKIPLGGTIDFIDQTAFKNFKFLDYLAGIIDEFDLSMQTNSILKEVYFEPTHPYSLTNDLTVKSGGYFNGNILDWNSKQDLTEESTIELFTDSDRELLFQYKDDPADGTLKKIQDRTLVRVGQAKYLLPERFTVGTKEYENRFFAPTMHYDVTQWAINGDPAPQMIIMAPENISNLSSGEAQNTFIPKSCYYKGLQSGYSWVFDGDSTRPYPLMFAVNYHANGQNDPILSYSDEQIAGNIIGKGLLRRFYHQRLAIMANGQIYKTWFRLNNNDIANFLHREFIICRNQKWEIIGIEYKPLSKDPAKVIMKKWYPI